MRTHVIISTPKNRSLVAALNQMYHLHAAMHSLFDLMATLAKLQDHALCTWDELTDPVWPVSWVQHYLFLIRAIASQIEMSGLHDVGW